MNIELIVIVGLCLVLGLVLAGYDRVLRELNRLKKGREEINAEAREKAVRILESAREKAVEIVSEAKIGTLRESEDINRRLGEVSEQKLVEYKQMLQNISKSVENTAVRELSEYKKSLEMETSLGQKAVGERVVQELAEYKAAKVAQIDAQIAAAVKKITLEVLGRSINSEDQNKIIISALEKAKNEGLFD